MGKRLELTLLQRHINGHKHMKSGLTSLVNREMLIGTTIKYYFTHTRIVIVRKRERERVEEKKKQCL